jgi:dephospho-CoA kinase
MARDQLAEADARRMIGAQADREARLAIADDVIRNAGDITHLAGQVQDLHARYLALTATTTG